jgi:geranylgeranyl diphosphate synthase, type II
MAMTSEQRYAHHRDAVERYLLRFVTDERPVTLYGPSRYVLKGGGKRIRPVVTLLACEAAGGDARSAIHVGSGIEILHNFTLVHDDIMDHSSTRRGRPTVHARWDVNIALLAGDVLLALAYRAVLRTKFARMQEIAQVFTEAVATVCEGQALDKEFETRRRVHVNEYLVMIEKKTGALLSAAAEIGGMLGGANPAEREALRKYGLLVGRAFQVQDDLLDVIGDERTFGKVIGGDLVEGKKTFLLLEAHRLAKGNDKRAIESILSSGGVSRSKVPTYRRIYEESGAIVSAERHVAEDLNAARTQLERLPSSEARTTLAWLTDRLQHRTV